MNKIIISVVIVLVIGAGALLFLRSSNKPTATPTPSAQESVNPLPTATQVIPSNTTPPNIRPDTSVSPSPTKTASPTATVAPQVHTVTIQSFAFSPANISVKRGDKVLFVNNDGAPHTVTAMNGSWDSGTLNNGASFTLDTGTLAVGTYEYRCGIHTSMHGTIVVQ